MLRRILAGATTALALLGAGAPAGAGATSSNFGVTISLTNPNAPVAPAASAAAAAGDSSGICTSQSLSEGTGAIVRVVCRTGQFVSIGPNAGRRFFGTHGGAYGYYFGPVFGAIHRTGSGEGVGSGTITSFRVYSIEETDGPLDLLVSF